MSVETPEGRYLGHLGLVSGLMNQVGLEEKIDRRLGKSSKQKLSHGVKVKAMVLNALGVVNTALYMTPAFFKDKPTEHLLGPGIHHTQLNSTSLGRTLDALYEYGANRFFSEVSLEVIYAAGLFERYVHLDSTSISVYGSYDMVATGDMVMPCYGYSKDKRPDLKQITLHLISLSKGMLPIYFEAQNGNCSDKKHFPECIKRLEGYLEYFKGMDRLCVIGDSALYGPELAHLPVDWLTRVPEVSREAKALCNQSEVQWEPSYDACYQIAPYQKSDSERWLLVRSSAAADRERQTIARRHSKNGEALCKQLRSISHTPFACEDDARKTIERLLRKQGEGYHVTYNVVASHQKSGIVEYRVCGYQVSTNQAHLDHLNHVAGRFVLATNVSEQELDNSSMLRRYKEQSRIEHGFKFLKDDSMGLDEVYLKSPERIEALMCIVGLSMLVFGLLQYTLRARLVETGEFLPDRRKKPTQTPTMAWIFLLFKSMMFLRYRNGAHQILNIEPFHAKILLLLGPPFAEAYGVPLSLNHQEIVLNQKEWLKWFGL